MKKNVLKFATNDVMDITPASTKRPYPLACPSIQIGN